MPDKKLTDSEIKKALECKKEEIICAVADENKATHFVYNEDALDLINRLQEENSNLTSDLTSLRTDLSSLKTDLTSEKAENERLKEKDETRHKVFMTKCEELETVKAEAYKECIEKVKEKSCKLNMCHNDVVVKTDYQISGEALDNLLKELVGEDNANVQ